MKPLSLAYTLALASTFLTVTVITVQPIPEATPSFEAKNCPTSSWYLEKYYDPNEKVEYIPEPVASEIKTLDDCPLYKTKTWIKAKALFDADLNGDSK